MKAIKSLLAKDHAIGLAELKKYIKNFRDKLTQLGNGKGEIVFPHSESFNKDAVQRLLGQKGCVGLRIFSGLQDDGHVVFILMGIDENGKNIIKRTDMGKIASMAENSAADGGGDEVYLEQGQRSPPYEDDSESLTDQ